ncbi:MAG: hypothetical protein QM708_03510 [Propioniciclava sp.]|uniref:hypothetical protein n=1 Tax=Propioniciclava sp. TaxID=2038686 RepID=UPI0039E34C55
MLDNLIRLREPAAWTAIAVTAVSIVLALVRFAVTVSTDTLPFSAAAQNVALNAMSLPLVIVVIALVWFCVFHAPLPSAGRIVAAAALVVTTGTVLTIVALLLGLSASAGTLGVVLEIVGGLLDVVLKLGAAVTLWLILRGLRGGRIDIPAPGPAAPAQQAAPEASVAAEAATQVPSWTPPPVTGTAWASASEAAAGAPGAAAPAAGAPAVGWHPVRRPAIGDGTTQEEPGAGRP